jgi:hypothetical protein
MRNLSKIYDMKFAHAQLSVALTAAKFVRISVVVNKFDDRRTLTVP